MLFFDGYIVPGWTDYPVTELRVGDSLRLYHVDDSQERRCWIVINTPLATVNLSDNNLSVWMFWLRICYLLLAMRLS